MIVREELIQEFNQWKVSQDSEKNRTLNPIEKAVQLGIISLDTIIEKAAGQPAQVGEIRKWSGVDYQKTATGWVPVKKQGSSKPGEKSVDSKEKVVQPEAKKNFTVQELGKYAKEASETNLQSIIKNSGNTNLREAAHNELKRRSEKEAPQKEETKKPEAKKPEPKKEEAKTPTEKLTDSIKTGMSAINEAAKNVGVLRSFERFQKDEELSFKNPEAIKAAKESEFYNVEEQRDGSLRVLGVKNPDTGEWAGKEKKEDSKKIPAQEDKSVQSLYSKLSDKSFRKLDRAKQYKLISEAEKQSKEKGKNLEQNFTDQEIDAMDTYASHAYRDINEYLRGDLKEDGESPDYIREIKNTISDMDAIIDRHELKEDLIVYRGQDNTHGDKDNKAYKSTSLDPYTAYNFARGEKPEVKQFLIPKGTKYAYMGGSEKEVVFGRDLDMSKFQTEIKKAEENELEGGKGDDESLQSLADKHGVDIDKIKEQLKMGLEVEKEHTDNPSKAKEIVMDHLNESSEYYTKLKEMEESFEKDKETK